MPGTPTPNYSLPTTAVTADQFADAFNNLNTALGLIDSALASKVGGGVVNNLSVSSPSATTVPLTVTGAASQSAALATIGLSSFDSASILRGVARDDIDCLQWMAL